MSKKFGLLFASFFLVTALSVGMAPPLSAQPKESPAELTTIKGRIFLVKMAGLEYFILRGKDANFQLKKWSSHTTDEEFRPILNQMLEIARKNAEAEVTGTLGKGFQEYKGASYRYAEDGSEEPIARRGNKIVWRVLRVKSISSIKYDVPPQDFSILFTPFVPPALPKDESILPDKMQVVMGKVLKYNFKSIIPMLELEGKPNLIITVPKKVKVKDVVGGDTIMGFDPQVVLKKGQRIEVWYMKKGGLNVAEDIFLR